MLAMKRHSERHQRQRGKNIALLVVLLALVGIFYAVTVVRLGGD
jgi:hypothetical protein